jgi:hypothetical protein
MLALRQVFTGIIIYIFAMLNESLLGYYGALGGLSRWLDLPVYFHWDVFLTRWGVFEAIHCIAWCVIINGLIHGIMSIGKLWKKPKVQMAIYAFLTVAVLVFTPYVWQGISNVYSGFPWKPIGTIYDPYARKTLFLYQPTPRLFNNSFGQVVKGWFFGLWAAPMQPLFPYLAVSFIGSIIGIACAQPKKAIFKGFMKVILLLAVGMFIAGTIGTILTFIKIIPQSFDDAAYLYRYISFHRHWAPDLLEESEVTGAILGNYFTWWSWLWQFLVTNGWAIMATLAMLYMVEFRGKGKKFADKTRYIRRFGFTAFTNYNQQYIYPLVNFIIPQIFFGLAAYAKSTWFQTFFQIGITIIIYQIIMMVWERVNYRGSLEWFMGTIGYYIVPVKKPETLKMKKWYEKGDLAVESAFYNAEWQNINEETEEYHRSKRDSRMVLWFAIASFIVPLFIPFNIGWIFVIVKTRKKEGKNKKNTAALILSIIGVVLTVLFSVAMFVLTPHMLGLEL